MGPIEYLVVRCELRSRKIAAGFNRVIDRIVTRLAIVPGAIAYARGKLESLTLPWAVLIGAAIIGLSIIASSFVAPYRISTAQGTVARINALTGEVDLCMPVAGSKCQLQFK